MRFKRHMELEHGLKQIDIAPLINVVFLLLMFFMLTSSFVMQPGIAVDLPKAVTSEAVKLGNIELAVSEGDVIYLDNKVVTKSALSNLLKQAAKRKQSVLIKSDRRASLGRLVEVWDMARESGVTQVNIATNQE